MKTSEIALSTLAYNGYPINTALSEIKKIGAKYVEPAYLARYDPNLSEAYFSEQNAENLSKELARQSLRARSVASHMDLGQPGSVRVFKKRMIFAKAIGADLILSNASSIRLETRLYENMGKLAGFAEELGLTIALENPGDGSDSLLGTGAGAADVLDRIGSDRVKMNYDFSNVFTYTKGEALPQDEVEQVLPYIGHLHLKNLRQNRGILEVCALPDGIIDYQEIFSSYPDLLRLPLSIEMPLRFCYDSGFNFRLIGDGLPPSLAAIRSTLSRSISFLEPYSSRVHER